MRNCEIIDAPDYYVLPCGRQLEDFIARKALSFPLGSAVKYKWRAGKKDGESAEKDLKKVGHYVKFLEKAIPYPQWSNGWENGYWMGRVDALVEEARNWDGK